MNTRTLFLAPLILAAALLVAGLAGCQNPNGKPLTSTQQLTNVTNEAAATLNALADLRDAGIVSQAEINQNKPLVDAFWKAHNESERQEKAKAAAVAAGQPYDSTATDDALKQVNAALEPLAPWLLQIDARKKARK